MKLKDERLFVAISFGTISEVEAALDSGASLTATNDYHLTPLHSAALEGRADVVGSLLDRNVDPNEKCSYDGNTALHFATMFGDNADVVTLLLERGANPNETNDRGSTPRSLATHRAIEGFGPRDAVIELLKRAELRTYQKEEGTLVDGQLPKETLAGWSSRQSAGSHKRRSGSSGSAVHAADAKGRTTSPRQPGD